MKIVIPDAIQVIFSLYKGDIYKIVGPFLMVAIPREGEIVRFNLGDDTYQGKVSRVIWQLVAAESASVQLVDIYLKEWSATK